MSERKITPLTGEGLELAKEFGKLYDEFNEKRSAMQKQLEDDIESLMVSYNDTARDIWLRLCIVLGIDADESFNNPNFRIDGAYIDYGFAAFIEQEPEPNPLEALFGTLPDEEATITVPDKKDLN